MEFQNSRSFVILHASASIMRNLFKSIYTISEQSATQPSEQKPSWRARRKKACCCCYCCCWRKSRINLPGNVCHICYKFVNQSAYIWGCHFDRVLTFRGSLILGLNCQPVPGSVAGDERKWAREKTRASFFLLPLFTLFPALLLRACQDATEQLYLLCTLTLLCFHSPLYVSPLTQRNSPVPSISLWQNSPANRSLFL